MSNVNFFARVGNLFKGFMSLFISDVEKDHPEIAYENSINSMTGKYAKLKAAAAAVIRQRDDISSRLTAAKTKQVHLEADLKQAMDTNQDDLAVEILQNKNAIDAEVTDLTQEAQNAVAEADKIKAQLLEVQSEIRRLKDEKDRNLAKLASAQARIKIQEQIEGLSVDAEVQALDNVRTHIKNVVAQASLGEELKDADLDTRMKKLRQDSSKATAQAQLAQLKAARAAQQAAPSKQM
jgi:phage shock protein A